METRTPSPRLPEQALIGAVAFHADAVAGVLDLRERTDPANPLA